MSGPYSAKASFAAGIVCLWLGCATVSPAPAEWRRSEAQAQRDPFGSWTNVTLRTGQMISGELIAVGDDAVYVGAHPRLHRLPTRCVTSLRVALFEASSGPVSGYGALGVLSTISHGLILVFSAPIWLMASTGTATIAGGAGHHDVQGTLPDAAKFARFPQGVRLGYIQGVPQLVTLGADCLVSSAEAPVAEPSPSAPSAPAAPSAPFVPSATLVPGGPP